MRVMRVPLHHHLGAGHEHTLSKPRRVELVWQGSLCPWVYLGHLSVLPLASRQDVEVMHHHLVLSQVLPVLRSESRLSHRLLPIWLLSLLHDHFNLVVLLLLARN